MASLFRPWKVYYRDAAGARCAKDAPGATKVKEQVAKWYGQYRDHNGVWKRVPLSTNRRAAESMLAELVRKADLRRAGLPVPGDGPRDLPWRDLVAEWGRALAAEGAAGQHLQQVLRWAPRFFTSSGRATYGAVTPDDAAKWFAGLAPEHSAQNRRDAAVCMRRFGRWCEARQCGPSPFAGLRAPDPVTDRRRVRAALTGEQAAALLAAARASTDCYRSDPAMDGEARYWCYRVAIQTGLRCGELRRVEAGSLTDGGIFLPGKYTKNRKDCWQPLPEDTFAGLSAWARGRGPGPLWPGRWYLEGARMVRLDLAAAGLDADLPGGKVLDFHALRHTFITTLTRAGLGLREAQELARHSDPRLTVGTYSHTSADRLRAALAGMFAGGAGCTPVAQAADTSGHSGILAYTIEGGPGTGGNYLQEDGF